MRWSVALVAVTGCSQLFGLSPPVLSDASGSGDDASDAPTSDVMADGPVTGSCVQKWIGGPSLTAPTPLDINTTSDEQSPFVTADGLDLYYAKDGDVYLATRATTSADFASSSKVASLSSASTDGKTFVSSNKLRAFFASTRPGSGSFDIFRGSRSSPGSNFAVDQMYLGNINTGTIETDPHLTDDLLHLYYSAVVSAKQGIMFATRATVNDSFGTGDPITELGNAATLESGPTLTADELVIVFASTRVTSFNATNLWYATRSNKTQPFGTPKLVPAVNTDSFDETPHISADGCELYFSSVSASYDLYISRIQ